MEKVVGKLYAIERITVGTGMPLISHLRYQKAHHIEVNHERGCLFEHILVPTLPECPLYLEGRVADLRTFYEDYLKCIEFCEWLKEKAERQ